MDDLQEFDDINQLSPDLDEDIVAIQKKDSAVIWSLKPLNEQVIQESEQSDSPKTSNIESLIRSADKERRKKSVKPLSSSCYSIMSKSK